MLPHRIGLKQEYNHKINALWHGKVDDMDYFTQEEFDVLKRCAGERWDNTDSSKIQDQAILKEAYAKTEYWMNQTADEVFGQRFTSIRKNPINQGQKFERYNWGRIYPTAEDKGLKSLTYTVGINGDDGFVIKIDTVGAPKTRQQYEIYRDEHQLPLHIPTAEGLALGWPELVKRSADYIRANRQHYANLKAIVVGERKIMTVAEEEPNYRNEKQIKSPLNQILYGPPGTGKTFNTIDKALEILEPELNLDSLSREVLKEKFDTYKQQGRIQFVTFHQSFSYEDFVEGLKATTEDGAIKYEVEDGIFKLLCSEVKPEVEKSTQESIAVTGKTIWKMSLGNTLGGDGGSIFDYCIQENEIRLGYGKKLDYTGCDTVDSIREKLEENGIEVSGQSYAVTAVNNFKNRMKNGDLVIITDGNLKFRAIGEIAEDYVFSPNDDVEHYYQSRKVVWHRVYEKSLPYTRFMLKKFSQMTIYKPSLNAIDFDKLQGLLSEEVATSKKIKIGQQFSKPGYVVVAANTEVVRLQKPRADSVIALDMQLINTLVAAVNKGNLNIDDISEKRVFEKTDLKLEKYIVNGYSGLIASIVEFLSSGESSETSSIEQPSNNRVLIIDEINRGNISSIFGELITLIEPSKRAGRSEELSVTLPYSKEVLKVPDNLFIIGTMNTADRSLALMDTALRRRFDFVELMPDSTMLSEVVVKGIAIDDLIQKMNQRIEVLYDREHTLGHAFFMSLIDDEKTEDQKFDELKLIFNNKILPLLEEYFFEDWEKIRLVLADNQTEAKDEQFITENTDIDTNKLFGSDEDGLLIDSAVYERNDAALDNPEAYRKIHG